MIERIGHIVRTVRERQSCSLEELCRQSGVPLATLAALEQGQPGITTKQLNDVAGALSLESAALLSGREVTRPVPSVFLRHMPMQDFQDADGAVFDDALDQGRALANLRLLLGQAPAALQANVFERRVPASHGQDAPAKDGYRLAGLVRRLLRNSTDPLADVAELLESCLGIAVVVRALGTSRVTAASVRADSFAAVVLNSRDLVRLGNPVLSRVYLSHELCHVLFDPSDGGLHIVIDSAADRRAHAAEQRARAFAAEFLLPLEGLVRLLGNPRGVGETDTAQELVTRARGHFGTSYEIAANHLCNLNFIDLRLREWLVAAVTPMAAGTVPETMLPADGASSRLVREYVKQANRDGYLTDGEARTILRMNRLAPLPWDEVSQ